MDTQTFVIPYVLENKSRIFDLGQGIHAAAAGVIRKQGGKVMPFSGMLRKSRKQALVFGVLAVLQAALMGVSEVTPVRVVLAVACALFGGLWWAAASGNRKAFERALELYQANNGENGTISIDEDGIVECSASGVETRFSWEDYRCCVMCSEAIVLISFTPVMLIISRTEETENGLLTALAAYDRLDSVYEVEIQEKKKQKK